MYWFFKANLEDALMGEAVLQILLVLAYLAIGLIAVTFPIYAISVNYLPREKSESEKEHKKRIEKLRERITKLTSELSGGITDTEQISQITGQLERYKAELEGAELKADYLTAKGAVRKPIIRLVLALLTAGIGIYFWTVDELSWVILFGLFSSGLSVIALYNLYKTISAVEYAALRPARTVDFDIAFLEGSRTTKTKKISLGKEEGLCICAITDDDDIENLRVLASFPPELEFVKQMDYPSPDVEVSCLAHCTTVMVKEEFLPKGIWTGSCNIFRPNKVGEYHIRVGVSGQGTYEVTRELTVRVVKSKSRTRKRK